MKPGQKVWPPKGRYRPLDVGSPVYVLVPRLLDCPIEGTHRVRVDHHRGGSPVSVLIPRLLDCPVEDTHRGRADHHRGVTSHRILVSRQVNLLGVYSRRPSKREPDRS